MSFRFLKRNIWSISFVLILLTVSTFPFSLTFANEAVSDAIFASEQQIQITGRVTDSEGTAIQGATVLIKDDVNATGTQTDQGGNFNLPVTKSEAVLEVSYVGFQSQQVHAAVGKDVHVTLLPIDALDEVVVVGYGAVKKRDLTGAVTSVKAEEIMRTPTSNVMDALQGKVSGMDVMKSSGRAGSSVEVSLRGTRSIYGDNNPLYIIDGIPGDFSRLNPSDIESIDVLKDASSTAIYGSAGSNGVVIITTKKGRRGTTSVAFDSYVGYNGFPKYPHGLVGEDYLELKREAYRGEHGSYPEFLNNIFKNPEHLSAYESGKNVDWVDLVLNDGIQQNYSLAVTGGTEKTNAYLSVNYNDEQGIIENDRFKKYGVRANIDHKIGAFVKLGTNLQLTQSDNDQAAQNIFGNSLTFLPLGDAYDDQGNIQHIAIDGVTNPLSDLIKDQYVNNTLNTYFSGNGYFELEPIKGLTFRSVLGVILGSARNGKYFGTQSIANPEAGFSVPAAVIVNDRNQDYRWENILTYNVDLNEDHHFTFTGVTSWAKNRAEMAYAAGSGFDLDSYSFYNLSGATDPVIRSSFIGTQSMSYVGRVNYNYKGKYLFSFSNRWDGVSRLSNGNKWDVFPAGAFAWRISDESFFIPFQEAVSSLKFRVGYGVTGNSGGVGAYGTQAGGFNAPKPVGFGQTAGAAFILNQTMANADLGWEKSYTTNLGLDATFLNGRIDLTFDWYDAQTKDLLYLRDMPASLGGSWGAPFKMWQNVGETNNRGFEVTLQTKNIERDNFTWSTAFTFARNRERIVSLPGNKDLISTNLFLNHPVETFYDYQYLGIWQESEAEEASKYNSVPGDIKLATDGSVDENGRHAYGINDKRVLGSAVPDWTGGIQNNFTYRNFDASIFLTARWGQMISSNLITRYDPTTGVGNSPDDVDYWTPENPKGYLPRPGLHSSTSGYIGFGALKYVDGSYFKIRNITLGYTLPDNVIGRIGMRKLRFYVTANNPFIFTRSRHLKYQDPEANGRDNFPLTKQFVAGVNMSF